MKKTQAILFLAGGMVLVAVAAFLGCRDGFPSLLSTLSLPSLLLIWPLHLPLWVCPLLFVTLFGFWAYPYSREVQKPKRSLYLGGVLGLLSLAYFIHGYRYAIEYQGAVYFVGMCIFGSALFGAASRTSLLAVRRGSRTLQVVSDALLFSWLAWLAFPYMGELP